MFITSSQHATNVCRLSVKERVRSEAQLSQLPLPRRLQTQLSPLYSHTIRCYIPDPHQLRDFVCRPPSSCHRLHCTMIRHDEDLIPTPGTCYTLYLEYLGGLVPLLKGKRISKIRPEFVIFDPQAEESGSMRVACNGYPGAGGGSGGVGSGGGGPGGTGRTLSDSSDTEHEDTCASPRLQRRRKLRRRLRERLESETDDLVYLDTLPEHNRLVEVTSNIWGTKFKLHGVAASLPPNLGQVTYKTSLLHLQPRQMTLIITELRDDIPPRPDPSFNPNVFSEDEEDLDRDNQDGSASLPSDVPPIAPMTPRRTPSSYSRHDMITPSPSPWDASSTPGEAPGPELELNKTSSTEPSTDASVGCKNVPCSGLPSKDEDDIYVDLAAPEIQQLIDTLRTDRTDTEPCSGSASSPSEVPVLSERTGSSPISTKTSKTSFGCDENPKHLPPTPSRSPSRFFDFDRKKISTSRPLDVEQTSSQGTPNKFFKRESKENRKKTTSEALLQQLNTLTVAAPASPLFQGASSVGLPNPTQPSSLEHSSNAASSIHTLKSNADSSLRSSPHQALTSTDSRLDVIRFIDEESGESDSRSFSPSPARATPKASCGSTFAAGLGGGNMASTIATSLANTFSNVTTSPRKRARSKSVGQLQAFEVYMAASSSLSACSSSAHATTVLGSSPSPFHQVQLAHHVHSLQQLTTVDAFLAFRRSLSLKDGKKSRATNGVTWPKLQHYGKSRSLDSSLLLLNKRNLLLNTMNNINTSQQQKKSCSNEEDGKLIITRKTSSQRQNSCTSSSAGTSDQDNTIPVGLTARSTHVQYFHSEHHNSMRQCTYNNGVKFLPKSKLRHHQSPSRSPLCDDQTNNVLSTAPCTGLHDHKTTSSNPVSPLLRRLPAEVHGHRRFNSQSNFIPQSVPKANICHQRQHSLGNPSTIESQNFIVGSSGESRKVISCASNPISPHKRSQNFCPIGCSDAPCIKTNCLKNHCCAHLNNANNLDAQNDFCNAAMCSNGVSDNSSTNSTFDGNCNKNSELNIPYHHHHHHHHHLNHYQHHYHHPSLRVETLERQQARGLKESVLSERLAVLQRECSPSRLPTPSPAQSPPTPSRTPPTPSRTPPTPSRTPPTPSRTPPTPSRTPPTPSRTPPTPSRTPPTPSRTPPTPSRTPPTPSRTPPTPSCTPPTPTHRAHSPSFHSPSHAMKPPFPQPPPTPRHTPNSTPESQRRALQYNQHFPQLHCNPHHPPPSPRRHVYNQQSSSHGNDGQSPTLSSSRRQNNPHQIQHQCTSTFEGSTCRSGCEQPGSSGLSNVNGGRDSDCCVCSVNSDGCESQTAPADGTPAHGSKSIPNTPARSRKQRRHQSSSPVRKHILSSPLLSRRRQRRGTVESSDEELLHCSSDAEILCSSSNYRDLETFQKTQLRNKLRRSRGRNDGILGTGSWGGGLPFGFSGDVTHSSAPPVPPTPRHKQFMMHNKAPLWNENSQVYQLDFGGRVTQESAKNFQIEFKGKQVMQFGRIDGNAYTLDFQYPFSAAQAFAVALANVTQRLK
ncbi:Tubby C-terminal [Trinorchestia longiramus]|nr:Tubby C-terminal [Trinorchestia longiramus]